jgi:hypothetical protein
MKKITLIAAAFAAISAVATAVSPAYATAISPAFADIDRLQNASECCIPPQQARRAENWSRTKIKRRPKIRLNPKVCYERQRVGPKQYVIVRRAC